VGRRGRGVPCSNGEGAGVERDQPADWRGIPQQERLRHRIAAYTDLLKLDPGNQKAQVGIALAQFERGDTKAAEDTLLKAAESPLAGRDVFYSLGEVKFTDGQTDEAIKWYERARAADPAWGKPLYKLGVCAMKKGDTAAAGKLMDRVIAVDPVSPEAALAKTTLDSLNK